MKNEKKFSKEERLTADSAGRKLNESQENRKPIKK